MERSVWSENLQARLPRSQLGHCSWQRFLWGDLTIIVVISADSLQFGRQRHVLPRACILVRSSLVKRAVMAVARVLVGCGAGSRAAGSVRGRRQSVANTQQSGRQGKTMGFLGNWFSGAVFVLQSERPTLHHKGHIVQSIGGGSRETHYQYVCKRRVHAPIWYIGWRCEKPMGRWEGLVTLFRDVIGGQGIKHIVRIDVSGRMQLY